MFQYFSTVSNVADEGEEDKSDNEGQEQVSDNLDTQIDDEMEDSQSTASASSNTVTTPPPLTPCRRPTPGKRMHCGHNKRDAIEERLLKIIEQPEKEPDEDEKFLSKFSNLSEENPRPSKEGVYKVEVAANNVRLHVWLTAQCRSDSTSASAYAYVTSSTKLQL